MSLLCKIVLFLCHGITSGQRLARVLLPSTWRVVTRIPFLFCRSGFYCTSCRGTGSLPEPHSASRHCPRVPLGAWGGWPWPWARMAWAGSRVPGAQHWFVAGGQCAHWAWLTVTWSSGHRRCYLSSLRSAGWTASRSRQSFSSSSLLQARRRLSTSCAHRRTTLQSATRKAPCWIHFCYRIQSDSVV